MAATVPRIRSTGRSERPTTSQMVAQARSSRVGTPMPGNSANVSLTWRRRLVAVLVMMATRSRGRRMILGTRPGDWLRAPVTSRRP